MDTFVSGVAADWTSFTNGYVPPTLEFFADPDNFRTAPYSQGILDIDVIQAAGEDLGAGVWRSVGVTADKVYMFVGFQDLYDSWYLAPPARRYAHFFGIGSYGEQTPPDPFTMGGIKWMGSDQWFYNDMPGNSTQVGGLHRCIAAWPARASQISIWTGVHAFGDAPISEHQTVFDADSHLLFEFDNGVYSQLENGDFEIVEDLTPDLGSSDVHRITLPGSWTPIGGGIGQHESYYADGNGAHGGSSGLRIYNKRGVLTRGVMQRVAVPPQAFDVTFSVWVRANQIRGTTARIGIDPEGGDDMNSQDVVWTSYDRVDEAWEQLSAFAACSGPVVTVFLSAHNQTSDAVYPNWADFDDASLSFTEDVTPPEPFAVTASSPTTLLHYLYAQIAPAPSDPETGISAVEYAIGTTPGGEEVRAFTACESASEVVATGLDLSPGQTYYIAVRATNGVGLSRTEVSDAILCQPVAYTYSWSAPGHLSQTAYNADNPRLATAQSDKLYVVWRESNDLTWDGTDSRIMLRAKDASGWQAPVEIDSAANAWWPDVVSTSGGVAVSYASPGDGLSNEAHVATGSGADDVVDQFVLANVSMFPRVADLGGLNLAVGCNMNPSGDPLMGEPSLVVGPTPWVAERLPGNEHSDTDMRVRIVSVGDVVHCLWSQFNGGEPTLYYCVRDEFGAYSQARLVASGAKSGDLAVGAGGEISVVYTLDGEVWYTQSADGVNFDAPEYLAAGSHPTVCVAQDGRVHVLVFVDAGVQNENGVDMVLPVHLFRDPGGWSMPQSICGSSCTSGIWAEEPGELAVDSSGVLHFVWSHNPHVLDWQSGEFRGYYWIDYHTTGSAASQENSVVFAKLWGDDAPAVELGYPASKIVSLTMKQVTAVGTFKFADESGGPTVWKSVPCVYIEEDNRVAGIRVIAGDAEVSPPPISIAPGDVVDVSGVIYAIGGERTMGYLTPAGLSQGVSVTWQGTAGSPVGPLGLSVNALGGASLGPTPGVTDGLGLNNVGLLVRVSGKVTAVGFDERVTKVIQVDDGCNAACGYYTGCKVYAQTSSAMVGDFVTVTGASSTELFDPTPGSPGDETYIRVIMPRDSSAVEIVDP